MIDAAPEAGRQSHKTQQNLQSPRVIGVPFQSPRTALVPLSVLAENVLPCWARSCKTSEVYDLRAGWAQDPPEVGKGPRVCSERAAAGGEERAWLASPCRAAWFHLMAARSVLEVKEVNRSWPSVFVNVFLVLPKELALLLVAILNRRSSDNGYVGAGLFGQHLCFLVHSSTLAFPQSITSRPFRVHFSSHPVSI